MSSETLVTVREIEIGDHKYSEMEGPKSGERWVHINNFKTQKNSVMIRKSDLVRFLEREFK